MHELHPNDFCREDTPWCYFVTSPIRSVEGLARNLDYTQPFGGRHAVVRIIRGQRCATPSALFQEWAAALQFPYYFGENWDAFVECMIDLQWLPGSCYVFVVTQSDRVLPDSSSDFSILLRTLRWAHEQWKIPNRANMDEPIAPFTIVFHAEPENADAALARIRAAGAVPVEARFSDEFITLTTDRP